MLSTTVPSLGVELHSSYLGSSQSTTQVTHLARRPVQSDATESIPRESREVPVEHAHDRCLSDHLGRLQELVATVRSEAVVLNVDERALQMAKET